MDHGRSTFTGAAGHGRRLAGFCSADFHLRHLLLSSDHAAAAAAEEVAAHAQRVETGDKVVTSGGIRGTVIAIKDDYLHLRGPPDNLRIEVSRSSVVSVTTSDEKAKAA